MKPDQNSVSNNQSINMLLSKTPTNIFSEMQQLGIDPAPFLAIAAKDLFNQFGSKAKDYVDQAVQSFVEDEQIETIVIWQKISEHLDILMNSNSPTMH